MRSTPPRSLAVGMSAVVAFGALSAFTPTGSAAAPDPLRRVIVTLDGPAASAAAPNGSLRDVRGADAAKVADARRALAARQDNFLAQARGKGVHSQQPRGYTLLIDAVAMTVPASEVASLAKLPGVAGVFENASVHAYTDVSVPLVGAADVWDREDPTGTAAKGTGVTVAVIDSGVDYSHPDLGGGFGEGHKVVAGYDFVNDDADPMDDNGHGTHVAGIIAGKAAQPGGITGVAPEATLTAYKAMDEWGYGETEDIVAAIEAASDPANPHRADVINMSLGGYADGVDPLGLAASAASAAGIVVVAAAGNDGPGSMSVGSPAAADGVIAVGASVSNLRVPTAHRNGVKVQTYRGMLSANPPPSPVTAQLADIGYGSTEELDAAGDLHGKIAFLNGYIAQDAYGFWQEQLDLAREVEKRGALALIGGQALSGGPVLAAQPGVAAVSARNAVDGIGVTESGDLYRMDSLIVMGMDDTQYAELAREMTTGPVALEIRGEDATDQIASFSSRGPSARWGLKPDIVAPGYEIRSTVPASLFAPGQYRLSGTSMAAPHVAGAAALLRQLHPDQPASELSAALIGSSKPLSANGPTTSGAGRLDIMAAADATLTSTPSSVSFGLADMATGTVGGTKTVTLHNSSAKTVSVALSASGSEVGFKSAQVTIPAGGNATATVTLKAKRPEVDAEISGYIMAKPSGGSAVTIPYLLVVHPLAVATSPDPGEGHTTVQVQSWTPLAAPPVITVDPPHGATYSVTTRQIGSITYVADLTESGAGAYAVAVTGRAASGQKLIGKSGFEVTPVDSRKSPWQASGPNSQGGRLALAPSDPDVAVMTTDYTVGPWLTTNKGATWKQLTRFPATAAAGLGTIIFDAHNADRFWYAVNTDMRSTVYRTDDQGKTWRGLDVDPGWIDSFVADEKTGVLAVLGTNGLHVSRDGGETWQPVDTGAAGSVLGIAIGGDDLYLSTAYTVWKIPGFVTGATGSATKVYDGSAKRNFIVSLVADGAFVGGVAWGLGVFGSADGGQNWSTLRAETFGLQQASLSHGDLFVWSTRGYGLLSHDHGQTWSQTALPSADAAVYDYDRWADGSQTMTTTSGLYRFGGSGFTRLGVQGAAVTTLAVSGDALMAGTENGIYRTTVPPASTEWGAAAGEGWIGENAQLLAVSPVDPKVVWKVRRGVFENFFLERSTDGGQTWTQLTEGSGSPTSLLIHPGDPDRVSVGWGRINAVGILSTVDGGQTWKNLYQPAYYTAMAGDPANPQRLWLGGPAGLYRSDDGGVTVTKVLTTRVNTLHLDGARLVVGGEAVQVSTDGGKTFKAGDTGSLDLWMSGIVAAGDILYASTTTSGSYGLFKGGRGVLRSTDGGMSWQNISTGLANRDVLCLVVASDGKTLFAGTANGVYRMPLR